LKLFRKLIKSGSLPFNKRYIKKYYTTINIK